MFTGSPTIFISNAWFHGNSLLLHIWTMFWKCFDNPDVEASMYQCNNQIIIKGGRGSSAMSSAISNFAQVTVTAVDILRNISSIKHYPAFILWECGMIWILRTFQDIMGELKQTNNHAFNKMYCCCQ